MKTKTFCMMVLCTGLLVGCDKEPIIPEEPSKPPVEQPEEPSKPEEPDEPWNPGKVPSTENIVKTKTGDINMIVGTNTWESIVYGNGKYVAVGGGGYITTSTDGVNWSTPKQVETTRWLNIVFGNGKFVALRQNGYITTSTDGVNWATPKQIGYSDEKWYDISYGNDIFVVIGIGGLSGYEKRNVITSTDGITWAPQQSVGSSPWWRYITHDGNRFIAICGNNTNGILTSTDGTTWELSKNRLPNIPWSDVWFNIAYENGKYIAVGTSGYVTTSTDGENWTALKQVGTNDWYDATYRNGKFVVAGTNGCAITSIDGENWTTPEQIKDESGNTVTVTLRDICLLP